MKSMLKIQGSDNIVNEGHITGDCVTGLKLIVNINFMEKDSLNEKLGEVIEALNTMSKTQNALAESMLKQKDIDAIDAEARLAMARAAENNSLANLNISKSIISDKSIIERILNIIEINK